jgi:DNA-binding SARP family transcriptional activator
MRSASASTTPAGSVRFSTLGPLRAWRAGAAVDLGPPQRRAVLVPLLLRRGQAVGTGEIIAAVWGDSPPGTAAGSVQTHLSMLRSALEPGRSPRAAGSILESVNGGYRADRDIILDAGTLSERLEEARALGAAGEFEAAATRYRQSLGMWHGEPLGGIPGPYAAAERSRLREHRMQIVEALLDAEICAGNFTTAVSELAALTTAHPTRERLRELQLRALHGCGRRTEALAAFADVRRLLVQGQGIEPGAELRRLHRLILCDGPPADPVPSGSTADSSPDRPAGRPAARGLPRPAQLPSSTPGFIGRDTELGLVVAAAGPSAAGASPLVLITGMAGTGKTALTVRAAHELRGAFPDGQLYAALGGDANRPADPAAVLTGFLRALGAPEPVASATLHERVGLYRTVLAERQVLILLDDAHSAAQVAALVPGAAGCAVLVTAGRRLMDLPTTFRTELNALAPADARVMLGQCAGPERATDDPAALQRLTDACHGLPLALRVIGARLAAHPQWPLGALAARVGGRRPHLAEFRAGALDVVAGLDAAYRQLHPVAARALRLMALPGSATVLPATAATVLDEPQARVEVALHQLAERFLLGSPAPERYAFHPLVQAYARQRSAIEDSPSDRDLALLRFAHVSLRGLRQPVVRSARETSERDAGDWLAQRRAELVKLARRYARHPGMEPQMSSALLTGLPLMPRLRQADNL